MSAFLMDEADLECAASDAAKLARYGQGVFRCQDRCENDYKARPPCRAVPRPAA